MLKYGASAPFKKIFEEYGFTSEHVYQEALNIIGIKK
jgi:transketolase